MAQFKTFAPGVEVNGETVISIIAGSPIKSMALQILEKNGIVDPQPGKWYSQQAWLNAFEEIANKIGDATLTVIGKAIPKNAKFPPEINSVESALASIDVAYHMNHRNGEIGTYGFEKTGEKTAKMICINPYPCAFDIGIITAIAKAFDAGAVVKHDAGRCRKKGAEMCTYIVTW